MHSIAAQQKLRLRRHSTGPGEVTAGQIATVGDIEITNPDLVLCHLDKGTTLNMELTVDIGKGYVAAQANRPADAPIGVIPVDALYSPVRQVAYKVENTRALGLGCSAAPDFPSNVGFRVERFADGCSCCRIE